MRSYRTASAIPLIVASLAVLMLTAVAHAGTPEVLTEAKGLYQRGKFAEAIDLLTKVAQESTLAAGESKDVYLLLAKCTAGKGFPDQSETYFRKVVEVDPRFQLAVQLEPPQVQKIWFKVDQNRPAIEPPDPGIKTIAILYFENNSVADHDALNGLSKGLAAMLATDLSVVGGLKVVERERIQYIIEEIKMEQSELFEKESAVRVGKLLGAHTLLMGSFTKLDKKSMRIDARLVKTETGEVLKAEKVEGKPEKLAQLQSELTLKIAAALQVAVDNTQKKTITADKGQPIEAVLAYTRGLNFEDEQKLQDAYAAYKQTLSLYPQHAAAKDRLAALEPVIAAGG